MVFEPELSDDVPVLRDKKKRTLLAERRDRLGPASAGLIAGALGGVAALMATEQLIRIRGGASLMPVLGRAVSRGQLSGTNATLAAFLTMILAGALFGACFATLTRHLRRFFPVFFFATVFLLSAWTGVYALALRFGMPWLASLLPFVPSLAGAAVLAFIVSMQVPLRVRT